MKRHPFTKPLFKKINNSLYRVISEVAINSIKDVSGYKEYLNCDIVFKENSANKYLFCIKIEDAVIIE